MWMLLTRLLAPKSRVFYKNVYIRLTSVRYEYRARFTRSWLVCHSLSRLHTGVTVTYTGKTKQNKTVLITQPKTIIVAVCQHTTSHWWTRALIGFAADFTTCINCKQKSRHIQALNLNYETLKLVCLCSFVSNVFNPFRNQTTTERDRPTTRW